MPPTVDRAPIPRPRLTTISKASPGRRPRLPLEEDMFRARKLPLRLDLEGPAGERAACPGIVAAGEGVANEAPCGRHGERQALVERRERIAAHQAEELVVQADDLRDPRLLLLVLFHRAPSS